MTVTDDRPEDQTTEMPETAPPEEPSTEIEMVNRDGFRGFLSLDPSQARLTPDQRASLSAIGIDADVPIAQVRVFTHVCQIAGLDPWRREAHLVTRGKNDKRTYTIQTGIDGYRTMATRTGRLIRRVGYYWTGAEDSDNVVNSPWWRFDEKEGAYDRVWLKTWIPSKDQPYPAAAKCVIEHYDTSGNVVRTDAITNWEFYAPMYDEWDNSPGAARGAKKHNPDGTVKQTLSEMWAKGGAHMLAKCAEAQAIRSAFPRETAGILTNEEMHRADAEAQHEEAAAAVQRRREAYAAATGQTPHLALEVPTRAKKAKKAKPEHGVIDGEVVTEPEALGDVLVDLAEEGGLPEPEASVEPTVPTEPEPEPEQSGEEEITEEDRRGYLLAEIDVIAEIVESSRASLTNRWVRAQRKNIEDATPEEIQPLVMSLRGMASEALIRGDHRAAAERYGEVLLAPYIRDLKTTLGL